MPRDDLDYELSRTSPASRVVSLVPSLTEAIAHTRPESLIGATDWCTHPADLDVTRVRGTKNPNRQTIIDLEPDLVIANKEENRELDVKRLRDAGVDVWVTDIETLDQAFSSMGRMFEVALRWPIPEWLTRAQAVWNKDDSPTSIGPARIAIPIWRDPWMVVGSSTFTGDLIKRLGQHNAFDGHPGRYPHVDLAEIDSGDFDLVLLPDEPYEFTAEDGPEAFKNVENALVSGRLLTWYGPSLLNAREELNSTIKAALG